MNAGRTLISALLGALLGIDCAMAQIPQARIEGAAQAERDNGVMGRYAGAGGDPALGETLYKERCASCHDTPSGRTPPKSVIADNNRTFIFQTLLEGLMKPMAAGLSTDELASIAAYLATRTEAGLGVGVLEAPKCEDAPKPIKLRGSVWNGWGNSPDQARYQLNPGLKAADVPNLKLKWAFAYAGTRNGQATVVGGRLFLTSSSGAIYALNPKTGCAYWRFDVPGGSRSSIVIGNLPTAGRAHRYAAYFTGWTERTAYALDAETGAVIWKRRVTDQQEVQMTGSPVLHAGILYVPISSAEEAIAAIDNHVCCKFRGAVVAMEAASGKVLWETFMVPPAKQFTTNAKGDPLFGPAGAAIWSAPTIDAKRGVLYVATGDSYTDAPIDKADAIVAIDLKTGAIRWFNQLTVGDNYIVGCSSSKKGVNCPSVVGPDDDFGASPVLHQLPNGKQVILAGQKSSQVYALDPDANGKVLWERRLSAGGALGGVEFGFAVDNKNIYVGISDIFSADKGAGVYAFETADGSPVWSAPGPQLPCGWSNTFCSPAVSQALTAMPGVVFAGAMNGHFRAHDAQTGRVIWDFDTAAAPVQTITGRTAQGGVMDGAGPTIADGMVYVSSGYQSRSGRPGIVLMAFSPNGR